MCEAGLLYSMLGHYDSALYCFNESIKLCNRVANLQRLAIALQNAGAILNKLGYYQEAIPKHLQAARLHGSFFVYQKFFPVGSDVITSSVKITNTIW